MKNFLSFSRQCRALGATLVLAGCNGQAPQTPETAPPVKNWMAEPFAKSPQVLLTNDGQFADGQRLEGASAFLVQEGQTKYAVTAKHLLGEGGGIEPQKIPSQLSKELVAWKLFARQRTTDTLQIDQLLNTLDSDSSDALVFSLKNATTNYQALTPRYDAPAKGEEVYLIGCPYTEQGCAQNRYPVRVVETSPTAYLLTEHADPNLQGFSGCPVVDKQGRVIGLLSSSLKYESGETLTLITPIGVVRQYLQK